MNNLRASKVLELVVQYLEQTGSATEQELVNVVAEARPGLLPQEAYSELMAYGDEHVQRELELFEHFDKWYPSDDGFDVSLKTAQEYYNKVWWSLTYLTVQDILLDLGNRYGKAPATLTTENIPDIEDLIQQKLAQESTLVDL